MKPFLSFVRPVTLFALLFCLNNPAPLRAQAEAPDEGGANTPVKAEAPEAPEPAAPGRASAHPVHLEFSNNGGSESPVIFSDLVVEKGQTNRGDALTIKGDAIIDGVVRGDTVVVFGNSRINGAVSGDLVVVMGSADLGPEAKIGGDAVVIGGALNRSLGSLIKGDKVVVDTTKIPGLRGGIDWFTKGLMLGRPLPFSVGWAWMVAFLFLGLNIILQLLFPRPIQACVESLENQPVGSFFAGLLLKLIVGFVCVLLAITVVGIVVIPFLLAAMVIAFVFGKIAMYRYLGLQVGRQMHLAILESPIVALILGTLLFYLLYTIPFLGILVWAFMSLFGMGAVGLATMSKLREEHARNRPAPAPIYAGQQPQAPPDFTPPPAAVEPVASDALLLPRAGFWIRLFATLLDAALFFIVLLFIHPHVHPPVILIPWTVYHVFFWMLRGTTIGGIILGLKVVRTDGLPMNFMVALVRGLAAIFSASVFGLGFIWAGFSHGNQSWHDKIAGTVIVRVPKGTRMI